MFWLYTLAIKRASNWCQYGSEVQLRNKYINVTSGVCDGSIISTSRGTNRSSFNHCTINTAKLLQLHNISVISMQCLVTDSFFLPGTVYKQIFLLRYLQCSNVKQTESLHSQNNPSYHYQLQSWRPSAVIWCSHGSICIMDLPTLWTIQFLHVKGCYRLRPQVGPCWHSNEFACMDSVLAYCQCAATVTAAHTVGEPCWHGTYTRTVVVVSGMQLRIA